MTKGTASLNKTDILDFTLSKYKQLLLSLQNAGYSFYTFAEYCKGIEADKYIVLRHDVDEMAPNALKMAYLENALGIKATYNFRIVRQSNQPEIIRQIINLGHEPGYHYEDLVLSDGDMETAIETFRENLAYFRTFAPVVTVCMHGSSTSPFDNRDLWKSLQLEKEGLIGEPYLSVNFNELYYLTDTGYCWDGSKTAVRDVVVSPFDLSFHHTNDIIQAINNQQFPDKAMILAHTLWTDSFLLWNLIFFRELIRNKIKRLSRNNAYIRRIYTKFVQFYWKH